MPYENRWPVVRRAHLLPKSSRTDGIAISIVEDEAQDERAWSFRSQQHTLFVCLEDGVNSIEMHIEGGPPVRQIPRSGSVWTVPATRRYSAHLNGSTPKICEIVIFETTDAGGVLDLTPVTNAQDNLLYRSALRLSELAGASGNVKTALLTRLAEAVRWHVVENYCSPRLGQKRSARDVGLTQKVRMLLEAHIRDHLGDRILLDELAEIAGLSSHNLLKRFRVSFGTTPAQHIINERVSQAQILLRRSSLQITEVALVTGFYSPSHFSTVFSKHVGMTPMAYRRQQ